MSGVEELTAQVVLLRRQATELAETDLSGVDAARAVGLHRDLRAAADRLGVVAARLLARVEADGRWAASGGARTFPEWAARQGGTSVGAARREVSLGQALESDLPRTRAAVVCGELTLEHAEVLARVGPTSPARRAALVSGLPDRDEGFQVGRAQAVGVDEFRREVRRWAAAVDAQAAEREHDHASAQEYLTLSRRDGGVALQGFLTQEHGSALVTALRAVSGLPAVDDDRSPQERDGAALGTLARVILDRGLAGAGAQVRPHLSVHVSWETLQALASTTGSATATFAGAEAPGADCGAAGGTGHGGQGAGELLAPAELDSGEPIPGSLLARLACDSEISRVVFGPDSHVLDVGRAHRTYTGQLRRAVVARDRTCRYPGCTAPPTLGEIHHIRTWADRGRRRSPTGSFSAGNTTTSYTDDTCRSTTGPEVDGRSTALTARPCTTGRERVPSWPRPRVETRQGCPKAAR